MTKHDIYRDGKVHLCKRMCATCIFRRGNLMHLEPGRRDEMVASAMQSNTAIVCHSTLEGDNAVCRGFFNKHATPVLRIAEAMGVLQEVEIA